MYQNFGAAKVNIFHINLTELKIERMGEGRGKTKQYIMQKRRF